MFDKMEVKRFQQEKPSAGAERKQVHSLDPGVERLPVLTQSIAIAIDIKVEVVYVFHRVFVLGYWVAGSVRWAGLSLYKRP